MSNFYSTSSINESSEDNNKNLPTFSPNTIYHESPLNQTMTKLPENPSNQDKIPNQSTLHIKNEQQNHHITKEEIAFMESDTQSEQQIQIEKLLQELKKEKLEKQQVLQKIEFSDKLITKEQQIVKESTDNLNKGSDLMESAGDNFYEAARKQKEVDEQKKLLEMQEESIKQLIESGKFKQDEGQKIIEQAKITFEASHQIIEEEERKKEEGRKIENAQNQKIKDIEDLLDKLNFISRDPSQ